MAALKTRTKNFSKEELATLVDLVSENKAELFGAFSTKLTQLDKDAIWEKTANTISPDHGTLRSKDEVSKKWCNILVKYKPIICDKLSSAKKTGGGPPEAGLTELEAKILAIKGRETFEGITEGIDTSMASANSPLTDSDMMISSPVNVLFAMSESAVEIPHPSKRKLSEISVQDNIKKNILENEVQKIELIQSIESQIKNLTETLNCKMDRIADNLEVLVSNQNKLITLLSGMRNDPSLYHTTSSAHLSHGYQNYFP